MVRFPINWGGLGAHEVAERIGRASQADCSPASRPEPRHASAQAPSRPGKSLASKSSSGYTMRPCPPQESAAGTRPPRWLRPFITFTDALRSNGAPVRCCYPHGEDQTLKALKLTLPLCAALLFVSMGRQAGTQAERLVAPGYADRDEARSESLCGKLYLHLSGLDIREPEKRRRPCRQAQDIGLREPCLSQDGE